MPVYFQRPENALKRAKEFIDVGKKQRALDVLYDVIKSKKHRTWQKIHEPIMTEYLILCVDLKKSHIAKEGLYQYKNICQQMNIKSLEDVVRAYLKLAEEKTEAAREESKQAVIDVEDLEQMNTPEGLLLSAVSGEDTQDRTDRLLLTPWVKFLWESYRQCLELLRNNQRVERLYHDVAQQAFRFCLKYTRKTEFRKLCDNLRGHLNLINKHQHQQLSINLNNPESQQMHLETRLVQLDVAIQMELWQEAFKASEDIYGLISMSKKQPKPQLMANYYQKLAMIFFKSNNHLFHAAAWHRLLQLSREQRKNLTAEEQSRIATRVMLATLSIPICQPPMELHRLLELPDTSMDKKRRLAGLLGLTAPPTRKQLVQDLQRQNILHHVSNELKDLFKYMESDYHPLKICSNVEKIIEIILSKSSSGSDELKLYIPLIQENTCIRLLKQLSQVYESITFDQLAALSPFADLHQLEKVAVIAARNKDLQVRIDHRNKAIYFGADLTEAQREGCVEGPYLQDMPSEQIRNQLVLLFNALNEGIELICPGPIKEKNADLRKIIYQAYKQTERREHERILERKDIIEERKVYLEELSRELERREQEKIEEQQRRQQEEERMRLKREAMERDEKRVEMERLEIQRRTVKSRLEKLKETGIGDTLLKDIDENDLKDMNVDDLLDIQLKQLNKEKKELETRLKSQEKKVDYFVRAVHLEELKLLQESAEKNVEDNEKFWDEQEQLRIEKLNIDRTESIEHRDRLARMHDDKEEFMKQLREERLSVYEEKMVAFKKRLEVERKKRLAERKERRKKERKEKHLKEKEEAEQRAREEQAYKEREERLRQQEEEEKQRKLEYEKRIAKLDEQMAKQQAREKEMEEKQRLKDEDLRRQDAQRGEEGGHGGDKAWKPGPKVEGGGWRQRQAEKEASWRGGGQASAQDDDAREDKPGWRRPAGSSRELGGRRGLDDERPAPRRLEDDRPPPRRLDDDRPPPRRLDDDRAPPRRFEDERGPRRFDDDMAPGRGFDDRRGGASRRFDDDRGPPSRRFGDDRGPGFGRRADDGPVRRGPDDRGSGAGASGSRWRDEDRGPPRRMEDRGGPPGERRFDDRGPPPGARRGFDDDRRGPPPTRGRFDDDRGGDRRDGPNERGDSDGNWRGRVAAASSGGGHPGREEVHKPERHRSPSPDRNRDSRFDDEEEDGWTRVKH